MGTIAQREFACVGTHYLENARVSAAENRRGFKTFFQVHHGSCEHSIRYHCTTCVTCPAAYICLILAAVVRVVTISFPRFQTHEFDERMTDDSQATQRTDQPIVQIKSFHQSGATVHYLEKFPSS